MKIGAIRSVKIIVLSSLSQHNIPVECEVNFKFSNHVLYPSKPSIYEFGHCVSSIHYLCSDNAIWNNHIYKEEMLGLEAGVGILWILVIAVGIKKHLFPIRDPDNKLTGRGKCTG